MRIDFEERIIQNPLLGAILVWAFISKYQERSENSDPANILMVMPVLPILLHQNSVTHLKSMRFDSGLTKALVDFPMMRAGLQERIASMAPLTFSSINLACAASLLRRETNAGAIAFETVITRLPADIAPEGIPRDMASAARRLGAFFADASLVQIQMQLGIFL
jgi:hypothetical protein